MPKHQQSIMPHLIEVLKWALTIFLLWPLLSFNASKMPLWRMVCGILLLVLILGKLFYDVFLDSLRNRKQRSSLYEFSMLLLGVIIIAALVAGAILVIGLYLTQQTGHGFAE